MQSRQPKPEWQYDEFCLVCTFMLKSLQTVQLIPFSGIEETVAAVEKRGREEEESKFGNCRRFHLPKGEGGAKRRVRGTKSNQIPAEI